MYYKITDSDGDTLVSSSIYPTINKIAYTGNISHDLDVLVNLAKEYQCNLKDDLQNIDGAWISGAKVDTGDDPDSLINDLKINGKIVEVITNSVAEASKTAVVTVTIASKNYENFDLKINVTTKEPEDAGVSVDVPGGMTYGDSKVVQAEVTNPGENGAYTWTSSDPSILSVTPDANDPSKATVKALKADATGASINVSYKSDTTEGETDNAKTVVNKKSIAITGASTFSKTYGNKAFSLGAKASSGGKLTYSTSNKSIATVSSSGTVTIKAPGTVKITVTAAETANYKAASKTVTVKIAKASQQITKATSSKTIKYSKLKKKTQSFYVGAKAKGKVTYKKVSGSKKITVTKAGKVSVKKKLKKGTYKLKVKISAASTKYYNAKAITKTIKIKVK